MDLDQDYYPVLSRLVMASAGNDPQLRQRIYDLARSKLRRRLDWEVYELSAGQRAQKVQALETAIAQIEADLGNGYRAPRPPPLAAAPASAPLVEIIPPGRYVPLPPPQAQPQVASKFSAPARRLTFRSAALVVAAAFLGAGVYVMLQQGIDQPAPAASTDRGMATGALSKPSLTLPIPEAYGVYAIAGGKLAELAPLSIRVPTQGVPISAAFSEASKTRLPSGRVQFIAFRRDLVGNVPDRVAVRVIARIMRAPSARRGESAPTDAAAAAAAADGWVIRNLSHEMKVGPVEGRPAMIVMRPADADLSLPAGRYALVLKGAAYDFTVDGQVTDLAQCVTRGDAVDAPVYAPCTSRP
jgi:hypothetical protein